MSLTKQQATALYVAVYNRAPDAAGLTYWTTSFNGTYAEAAAGFVGHSQFQNEYGGLSNEETIEKFYTNMLGSAGDAEGIAFWTAQLDDGATEAEVLASFLDATLSYAGNDAAALTRQATLENKVEVGIFFAETLGDASNPTSADLNNDPAYLRSIEAIAGVTADDATVAAAQEQINSWVVDPVDPEVEGQTFFLTEGADRDVNAADGFIKGTNDDDTFIADIVQNQSGLQVNTLGTGDRLDGGNGANTLNAQVTQGAYAGGDANMGIQAQTKNIQEINLEAVQSHVTGLQGATPVYVNAKDMVNVNEISSDRSNASLTIQDLTSKGVAGGTADMTIGMKYTGNADTVWKESDLHVYFDQDYLLRTPAFSKPTVDIQLMNEDAYSETNGEYPLAGVYLRELTITVNGTEFDLTQYIDEDVAGNGEEIRTYDELLSAIQGAIAELKADHPNNAPLQSLEANMGPRFEADIDPQNNLPRIGESVSITVEGETNGVENTLRVQATDLELGRTSGTRYENNNRFERANNDPAVETEDLVTVGVELEKVGRAADGGDLVIGSMNKDGFNEWSNEDEIGVGTVSGVERFNVTVDGGKTESSSLASLRSTNNNLREVNIVSADGSDANLTIGNSNTDDFLLGELEHAANALKDVQTLNASGFKGDLDVTAALTGEVTDKYLKDSTVSQKFEYTGGTGNDTFDILLSADNLASSGNTTHGRFDFALNSGVGNDTITVGIYDNFGLANAQGGNAPWFLNQKTNSLFTPNLRINAGEGDDAVNLQGSGEWTVNLGAGHDVIYVDNAGASFDYLTDAFTGVAAKASWIFNVDVANANAYDVDFEGNVADGWTDVVGAGNATYNLYQAGVNLTLTDDTGSQFELNFSLNTNSNYQITQKTINEQIKWAIDNDATFSKLVEATTGQMADTLIIDSLIDGNGVDLDISIVQLAAGSTQAQIDNFNSWYGSSITLNGLTNAYSTNSLINDALVNGQFSGASTATVTGSDGNTYGYQTITGGIGDDVFVLGTSADQLQTLVYEGYGNGKDTILNFTAANTNLNVRDYDLEDLVQGTYANEAAKKAAVFGATGAAQDEHVILFNERANNAGEYTVEVWKQDATADTNVTLVGTIGVLDFGQSENFTLSFNGDLITA